MKRLHVVHLAACVALADLCLGGVARAADPAFAEAKVLAQKASIEYDVGHFDQALELYTKAYERYPKPALLFDIGQCQRLLGHHERALFFFQGYLRAQPEAKNRPLVETLMQEEQQKLDAQRAAETANAPSPAATAPSPAAPPDSPSPPPSAAVVPPDQGPGEAPSPTLLYAGVATAGVGAVLLGIGVYSGLHSQSLANQVSQVGAEHGTWTTQDQSNYDSGRSAATVANVMYVTGAVALAAGGVLTWLGWRKTHAVTAAACPAPGGGSVSLVARF
jgi:tetratricopeptide (TPR) repeat protein